MTGKQLDNRFSRTALVVGDDGVEQLRNSHVAVFGLGGVGGYAVEALARAGIGHLTLVDFDSFSVSNINRQLHALDNTIGCSKVEVVSARCKAINPHISISEHRQRYTPECAAELLTARYNYVLDCIDTISAKIDLIQQCVLRQLPIISSMGAANKIDPTQVRVAKLFDTEKCRLARIMRKELRRRGINFPLPVVYSLEQYRPPDNAPAPQKRVSGENWQQPPLGSVATIPSLFGIMMAGVVVQQLVEGSECAAD